ncbi:Protein suppressor of white apricot [Linum perenne]
MDLEVVGRHALLFDDDAMAAFTNSLDALVEWNSLSIDRYDVRHLLTGPLPSRVRRRHRPDDPLESELDHERYLDLQSSPEEQDIENEAELANNGGYNAVAFSYGESSASADLKNLDADSCFRPPFSVPEHLVQKLPPTEKLHLIIARTAMFVSTHGGQSEIVLRVKQGNNPSFGFLMPDHDLHPYFRFLVDHQELLKSDINGKSAEEDNKSRSGLEETGGALSLLGSVYGSGEDEESAPGNTLSPKKGDIENAVVQGKTTISEGLQEPDSSAIAATRDETVINHHISSLKDTPMGISKSHSIKKMKAGTIPGLKKDGGSSVPVSSMDEKVQSSGSSDPYKIEIPILQPPSHMKRVVDKIVEFILRNGREFEAVLVQQDANYKRFPFLLPSNQYHSYYLKTLQNAQEVRASSNSEKHVSSGVSIDKTTSGKESDSLSIPSDIPYDSDRKERFKMVIGKSKKEETDTSSKASQSQVGVSMDAEAVAAILQAARKGIKHPNLKMVGKNSRISGSQCPSSDGGESSSLNSLLSKHGVSVSQAKVTAKNAALAAANEADSSEASLTREQKLKAERLRRAKMFAAMIKSGAAPLKSEPLRALSVDPPDSGLSRLGASAANIVEREKVASLVQRNVESPEKIDKSENRELVDTSNDRRSKRTYRARSGKVEDDEVEEDEEEEEERDRKHSKKKRSHGSSHRSRESRKHRRKHSSSKDRDSRGRHMYEGSSDDEQECSREHSEDEHRHYRREHKEHISSKDKQGQKNRHSGSRRRKHDTYSDEYYHMHSGHKRKLDRSSNGGNASDSGEEQRQARRHLHKHNSDYSGDECEHNGEGRLGDDKTGVDMGGVGDPKDTIDVSDELRAKVRAMLATI